MGTYIYARLKNKNEKFIKEANKLLTDFGYPTQTFNGVPYGFFTTRQQLREDARFMNEEPEGKKQLPYIDRPITVTFLKSFFWNEVGCGVMKIAPGGADRKKKKLIYEWLQTDDAKRMLDLKNSDLHLDRAESFY